MEWQGEATVMTQRRHGENAVILTVLSRDIGLLSGMVPGGASSKRAAMLQPGSRLSLRWRARLEDQLGGFSAEPARSRPGLIASPAALAGVNAVTSLLTFALPERDPHPRLVDLTETLLDQMDSGTDWAETYILWELRLLDELGFGLDLGSCAVTGQRSGLAYVSPRTGRAVSAQAAGEWAPKLLPLPAILGGCGNGGVMDALALTGHFLETRLAEAHAGKPLPPARARLVSRLRAADTSGS
ncbi:DNA repair protein RecO [Paracoccus sp. MBLB3053]|uniref:DNA repair protein RecO n=1 Tax=Paracoccus aurantius TaxID=3073814 RepID=A0ABU2HLQ8_9RHOB|nr:DNA repair protein RecO [Paracoccus sp. MBLB3053]MDS9465961.1 DNA repair protein RecO [Paracoccus sp. MBLB3053]